MVSMAIPGMEILRVESVKGQGRCRELKVVKSCHGGALQRGPGGPWPSQSFGWVGYNAFGPTVNSTLRSVNSQEN